MSAKFKFKIEEEFTVDIEDIITREPFSKKFTVYNSAVNKIANDMVKNGYDPDFPITVFRENGKFVVLDGHKRLIASKKSELKKVYVELVNVNVNMFNGYQKKMDDALYRKLGILQFHQRPA